MKLGFTPSKPDARDLRFSTYLAADTYPTPPLRDWTQRNGIPAKFTPLGNLEHGCCTCTAIGNLDQAAAFHLDRPSLVSTDIVLEMYDAISEWDRNKPLENDNGASCRDALRAAQARGLIEGYVRLDASSRVEVETAINMGCGVYAGLGLPRSAQRQTIWDIAPPNAWTEDYEPRSWGGHALTGIYYDRSKLTCVTWGALKSMTWSFWYRYAVEAWLAFPKGWTAEGQLTPSGFSHDQFTADVARLRA